MVGGATNQQSQPSQLAPPPSSASTAPLATTEEEEFLKRNTDCVYFLASPLTCKKGSECEYRHSDIARVNPRDCWYWLNGNCLNPKCAFRHPPLDGLLGSEVPTPVGHSIPQVPITPASHATPYPMSKQGVACIFFQKGFCLKGHLCPFSHGPPPNVVNNKSAQPVPPNPVANASKMEKPIQEQKFTQQENIQKPIEFPPPQVKQASNGGRSGGSVVEKKVVPEEPPRYRPPANDVEPVMEEYPVYETHQVSDNEGLVNGKDVEEYSREPTPGFDVLVDDELNESEYYPNEEQFRRSRGQEFDVDQDMYSENRDFDHYNGDRYAWEDRRESSERLSIGATNFGRKRYPRDESPDQFDKTDLRYRIKQRRGNVGGLRSVISRDNPHDNHTDRMPRRDNHHNNHHNRRQLDTGSLSSRLRGRITIPGNGNESRVEREFDMGRHRRSRYSPGRPLYSSNHNRVRDRIKGRSFDDYNNNNGREYRSSRGQLDVGSEHQTDDRIGKRKFSRTESQQPSEDNKSFEGPKPLSEILKRKRGSVLSSVVNNNEDNNNNNSKEVNKNGENGKSTNREVENKDGMNDEDVNLDEELEAYDNRDGDYYDYENIDGEDYNLEEGEEYVEEEEEGGKKESEVYS